MAGSLTLEQINQILEQMRGELEPFEIEGLRAALLMRVAKPDNVDKLRLSVELMPPQQKATVDDYLTAAGDLKKQRIARGKAALDAITDDEWDELVRGTNEEGNE